MVAEVFLKKEERIEALAALMAICLFVYGVAEFRIRKGLSESGEFVPNQKDKPINNPTLKWVFFLFRRVREITIIRGSCTNEFYWLMRAISYTFWQSNAGSRLFCSQVALIVYSKPFMQPQQTSFHIICKYSCPHSLQQTLHATAS